MRILLTIFILLLSCGKPNGSISYVPNESIIDYNPYQRPVKHVLNAFDSKLPSNIVTVFWRQISGPTEAVIAFPFQYKTEVTGLNKPGIYSFELSVTDDGNLTGKDTVEITVNSAILLLDKLFIEASKDKFCNHLTISYGTTETVRLEIESSKDGNSFMKIAETKSNHSGTSFYRDDNYFPVTYYRVKQVDAAGRFSYSNIATVENKPAIDRLNVFQVSQNIIITYESAIDQECNINIVAMNGVVYPLYKQHLSTGINRFTYDASHMTAGMYVVVVKVEQGNSLTFKFIKK